MTTPQNLPRTEDDTPNYLLKEMLQAATTRAEELENEIRRINDGSMLQQEIQKNIDLTVKCSDYDKLQAKLEQAEKEVARMALVLEGYKVLTGMGGPVDPIKVLDVMDKRLAQLQARVGEESKLYQENIDIWQRKYSDAIEINERYKNALEFYADRYHYDDGTGMVGKLVSSSEVHGEPTDADWEPDFGHIARNALKLNRYGHELGCTCTPGCEFENGWG